MVVVIDLLSNIYMLCVDNHLHCKFGYNGYHDRLATEIYMLYVDNVYIANLVIMVVVIDLLSKIYRVIWK